MSAENSQWIPILDYAVLRGISTSTLRRYIKAKKIQYKIENGRYLLLADAQTASRYEDRKKIATLTAAEPSLVQSISVFQRVRELEEQLLRSNEQISELKMLVAIYEEKLAQRGPGH